MTEAEILRHLVEKATQQFGASRADELKADLEKTAAELAALGQYPLTFENES